MDIDDDTVTALRAYRVTRSSLAPELVRDSSLVLGNLDGTHSHPSGTRADSLSRSCRPAGRWGRTSCPRSGCRESFAAVLMLTVGAEDPGAYVLRYAASRCLARRSGSSSPPCCSPRCS